MMKPIAQKTVKKKKKKDGSNAKDKKESDET